ncbi:MAG: phosphoserine phosphatase SerB [Paraglaciecola sp.]|uniref:phosphoserine phosphatase SerB n=1 Tax=Paraglaciecola sp. TaxID=1920173 RepID=UPI0027400B1D|nr:phosphoserine phosphatase SerB [Paraglaciecola sp.]MDP5030007.1 phosphoserine phosphatase SerB [Paraglaciecola sp.]MDP5130853.1 phosphoserine phosphatase SerB [Paraglaciecola sp.]
MFVLSLTPSQLVSSAFLTQLVEQGLAQFTLTNLQLISSAAVAGSIEQEGSNTVFKTKPDEQTLVVFTEGLNLQLITQLSEQLNAQLNIAYWYVVKVDGKQDFALAAKVAVVNDDELKQQCERIANRFSVELCLVKQKPSLDAAGLLLMDMDSTVIACECIDDIAMLAGVGEQVSAVTAQAMQGKLDFAQSLRTRVACLTDADESILQTVRDALPLMPGVANLVKVLKHYNWKVAIASGGFTYFADYLAERLELDAAMANKLEIIDGKLTGKVDGDIVDAQVKAHTLLALADKWSIPHSQTIAMGDGANDLVMMDAAALGVALHAKPIVREKADIAIRRGGLDTLLWILGA